MLQALLLALAVVSIPVTLRFDATGGRPKAVGPHSSVSPALQRFANLCSLLQDGVVIAAAAVCVVGCAAVLWLQWRKRSRRRRGE